MKAAFRTFAAAAIICASAAPAISQTAPAHFQIYTNSSVSGYKIREIAGAELAQLATRIDPVKYDLLVESEWVNVPDAQPFFLIKVGAMPRGSLQKPTFYVQQSVNSPMTTGEARKAIRAGIKGLAEEKSPLGQKV